MKEQIIQLEAHDDVTSVRDKIGWVRAQRVLLVLPNGDNRNLFRRRLDLLLVQRELTRRQASFAIITDDLHVVDHAQDLGIATFASIDESRQERWRTRSARLGVSRDDQPKPYDAEVAAAASRLQPRQAVNFSRIPSAVGFGLGIAALLIVASVALPGATVTLAPAGNQIGVAIPITADPNAEAIDFQTAVIPARIVGVEVEERTTIETSGITDIPTQRSGGVVTFINRIPEEITIPAGTIVRTTAANPIRFATTAPVTLPDNVNSAVDAPIEAIEPGVEANLPSNLINGVEGPLASRVRVINAEGTRGGDIRQVGAVSQDDYDRLRAALLQQLQQRAFVQMDDLITDTEFIVTESLLVVLVQDETFDRFLGEVSDTVSLEMRVVVQGVVIDEQQARQVALDDLSRKVGPEFNIGESLLLFKRGEVTSLDNERRVTFLMQGSGDVTPIIDEGRVQELTRGKSLTNAQNLLESEFPLRQPPEFDLRLGLLGRMPLLPFRIQVEIINPA